MKEKDLFWLSFCSLFGFWLNKLQKLDSRNTIQYNTTVLSLCREICLLARHLHKTFNTFNNKTSTTQWNVELKIAQMQGKYLTVTTYTHTHAPTHTHTQTILFSWSFHLLLDPVYRVSPASCTKRSVSAGTWYCQVYFSLVLGKHLLLKNGICQSSRGSGNCSSTHGNL